MQQKQIAFSGAGKLVDYFYLYGIYFVFAILLVFFSMMSPHFLTVGNFVNIFQQSAALGIATVGMVFVMITAGIDISVASTMYVASCLGGMVINKGMGLIPALFAVLLGGAFIGAINGFVISKYKIVPFIATLATMSIGRGLGLFSTKAQMIFLGDISRVVSGTHILGIPITVYVLLIVILTGNFVLRKTQFGRQLLAIGADEAGAEKAGIFVKRKIFSVYIICGILAGFAGFISAAQVSAIDPKFAVGNEFTVISAAVLGGTSLFGGKGNIFPGALVGVLIVTIIGNGLNIVNASPYAYPLVRGIIIFFAVMIDSIKNNGELR
jgi:ribose transport system permease protein